MQKTTSPEQFIQQFLPLVPKIVARMRHRIPRIFETADLIQSGRVGLVIAARTFDSSKGRGEAWAAEFWARQLIRREVLNAIARKNWLYAKGRTALPEDPQGQNPYLRRMGWKCTALTVYQPAPEAPPAAANEKLAAALEVLTPRERKVIELVYVKGLTHSEIARERLAGVSRVKVIRHHKRALDKLRERLTEREAA